ncbi:MAG: hypothetical protein R2752_22030 [Vicinamibacterales bacterium]
MNCTRHFLAFHWNHHAWNRRVTHTTSHTVRGTDMWSRAIPVDEVICTTQYVCRICGAVRDAGQCGCDQAVADACAGRLALLDRQDASGVEVRG